MRRNFSDYLVALVVIACSVVLLAALTVALSGWRGDKSARSVEIDYPDVTGIRLHSEVRYAGAVAGNVSAIRLLTFAERNAAQTAEQKRNAVRVTVALRDEVPPLPNDVRAFLASETLLSEKFVALSAGSPDAPKLAPGAVLQGRSGGGIDSLADSLGPLVESIGPLLKTADELLRGIAPVLAKTSDAVDIFKSGIGDTLPRVSKLADGLHSTSAAAERALARIDKLVDDADAPIKTDLAEVKRSLLQLQRTLGAADEMLAHTDKNLASRMQELGAVLQNLKVVATQAKAFTQAIAEKPNRIIFSGKPQKLTPENEILRTNKPVPAVRP